jgi:hypothetical protein
MKMIVRETSVSGAHIGDDSLVSLDVHTIFGRIVEMQMSAKAKL